MPRYKKNDTFHPKLMLIATLAALIFVGVNGKRTGEAQDIQTTKASISVHVVNEKLTTASLTDHRQ